MKERVKRARKYEVVWGLAAFLKHKSRGQRITIDTGHIDSVMAHQDALEGEGEEDSGVRRTMIN